MDTDRPRSIPSNIYKFVILSLVTLLQKDIVWGKGNKVVGDSCGEPTSSASNPATPKGQKGRGRPRNLQQRKAVSLLWHLRVARWSNETNFNQRIWKT